MKQAVLKKSDRAARYAAVLGVDMIKMHKAERPRLSAMCLGDVVEDEKKFWELAAQQMKGRRAGAIYIFDQFAGDLASAPEPNQLSC